MHEKEPALGRAAGRRAALALVAALALAAVAEGEARAQVEGAGAPPPPSRTEDEAASPDARAAEPAATPAAPAPAEAAPAPVAPGATRLQEVVVRGRAHELVGAADSASEGIVGQPQVQTRPLLRPGEVLETVPGLIATQHSGNGKANQYFLRGFNLDHGTDLATSVNGIPINLPSHGHGQGYTDVNFLIPELIREIHFRKGPYYADAGDFASAGIVGIEYFDALPAGIVKAEGGQYDYGRLLVADSPELWAGRLLYALEGVFNGGPWDEPDDFYKVNGFVRYTSGDETNGVRITALGYHGDWSSTDQIPKRAVDQGIISRWGTIDPSDAGRSSRYSLSGEWYGDLAGGQARVLAYGYYYDLSLFSNFTYFLDEPERGDQFEQKDERAVFGLLPTYRWSMQLLDRPLDNTVGLQVRSDWIDNGLYSTQRRNRFAATRYDDIVQTSVGLFFENRTPWTSWFRTVAGARVDVFDFDVRSNRQSNSDSRTDAIASPKLNLIFGPWYDTELYLSGGFGFHSNDARGVVSRVDPRGGDSIDPADPLVRSKGAEIGIRTTRLPGLQSTLGLWILDIDSELLFIGDAGNTEASRPSRRYGIEWANYYSPTEWLTLDADFSFSRSRFRDDDPAGDHIPGSIEAVIASGITVHDLRGFFGSFRMRYFGPRALTEDDSERSKSSTLFNLQAGYRYKNLTLALDVFNVFDVEVSDIDYFYTSRLPGEPDEGVDDVHFHPAEPRAFRGTVTWNFGSE